MFHKMFPKRWIYVTHLILDEHSIMETFIFHVAPVVVVAIVNVKVEAVADRPCSRYTINKKKVQLPKKAYTWQTSWGKEIPFTSF